MTTHYAEVLQRDLLEELAIRTGLTVTSQVGTNGDPMVLIGAGTTTTQSLLIRILPESTLQSNSVGVTQPVYAPHIIQVQGEQQMDNASSPAAITNQIVFTTVNFLKTWESVLHKGTKVELYIVATGSMPLAEANFVSGNLVATVYPNYNHPLTAQS